MFNSSRATHRYTSAPSVSSLEVTGFIDQTPLAASIYDHPDPWSNVIVKASSPSQQSIVSSLSSVISSANIPETYNRAFALTVADRTPSGETSVSALSRVLSTSMSATTVNKIVTLVSSGSQPRVSKLEFFVALALSALVHSGDDISMEQVAAIAAHSTLPEPFIDLDAFQPSTSVFSSPYIPYKLATLDPWNTSLSGSNGSDFAVPRSATTINGGGATSSLTGSGLPRDWWKKQEVVDVTIQGQQGFILNRYTVYEVTSHRGAPVHRRYSEFVFLWDCLVRRYPFRLLPVLPPKRVQPGDAFIEQRRKGLARFLSVVINHPVIKEDGLLATFLSEPFFETWRKQNVVSLEEECVSKRIDRVEEMTVPSDLEEKLAFVRGKINPLIEQWQRICVLTERIIKRRESAAADLARLTNVLRAVVEVNERCWRGDECELCDGVRQGIGHVAFHTQQQSDLLERRTNALLYTTLEGLKSQRDLYIAMRDLFVRRDRLSVDNVDRLKKRVDSNSMKLEGIKAAQKDGWQEDADRVVGLIEKDQATISTLMNRRVSIRASMWHELRVVLHNRENTLLSKLVQNLARDEQTFADNVLANWISLGNAVEGMPYE